MNHRLSPPRAGAKLAAILAFAFFARPAAAQDALWTFNANGLTDYSLVGVSSSQMFSGPLPANDPTLNLTIGKRYRVTNLNPSVHPFQIIAKAATFTGDAALLAQGIAVGSMEGNSGVAWADDGMGNVTFTMTQALLDAMKAGGRAPGYRCGSHSSDMRGDFNVQPPPFDFSWTFSDNGVTDYRLTTVSSAALYSGALPADDPTITLQIGNRYRVTIVNSGLHPIGILAKGATSSGDAVLLSQFGSASPFEADPGVAWFDDGMGVVEFTLTPALISAMSAPGQNPGYRCDNHPDFMRGDFNTLTLAQDWERYE